MDIRELERRAKRRESGLWEPLGFLVWIVFTLSNPVGWVVGSIGLYFILTAEDGAGDRFCTWLGKASAVVASLAALGVAAHFLL